MIFAPGNGRAAGRPTRLFNLLLCIPLLLSLVTTVFAQDCSATSYCETGCCSKWGNCGVGDEFSGDGCLSTCDYKLGCDKDNPCADGTCCSSHGFCGLGPDCKFPLPFPSPRVAINSSELRECLGETWVC